MASSLRFEVAKSRPVQAEEHEVLKAVRNLTELATGIRNLTNHFHHEYDPEFDKAIRRVRPDWFTVESGRKGQAILEFALILPLLFGFLALVVDLGFGQYRHQVTHSIAEGAATSSAVAAMQAGTFAAGSATCPTASGNNLSVGCQYAQIGSSSAFQTATVLTSGLGAPAGVTNPATVYWVTAVVSEKIAPMFGAGLNISSTSTAAVWSNGSSQGVFLVQ
jgi:hypothetical protein